jgi:mannosyltransferase
VTPHPVETPRTSGTPRPAAALAAEDPTYRQTAAGWYAAGALLVLAGLLVRPESAAAAAAAAGGPAGLTSGFELLRLALVLTGGFLVAVARFGLGVHATPLLAGSTAAVSRGEYIAVALLLVAGLALRLPGLGEGLWHDEIVTLIRNVRAPLVAALTSFESQNNHPLYSLLAQAAFAVFGDSPAVLRLPALLFGVGSIAAVWWFGVQIGRSREALLAAAVLTFSYHHVWFSQNARAYTILLFCALIGTTLFVQLCRADCAHPRRIALAYAAVMTVAVYGHLTAAFIVVGHLLAWAFAAFRAGRPGEVLTSAPALGIALSGLFSVILYAVGLPDIAAGLGGAGPAASIEWKNPVWMLAETARELARALPGGYVTLAVGGIAPLVGALSFAARDRLLLALMVAPAVLTAAVMLATGHNLWPRFFFFAAGFAVLILVRGVFVLAALQRRVPAQKLATAVLALLVLGSATVVPRAWGAKQDFAGAAEWLAREPAAGDAVVIAGIAEYGFRSYLGVDWPVVEDAAQLRSLAAERRTWVVYAMPELIAAWTPALWETLERDFRRAAVFRGTLAGGAIIVRVSE